MRIRKRISVPLLLSFAVLGYSLLQPQNLIQRSPDPVDDAGTPESYARDIVVRDFSPAGELLDETRAAELRRFDNAGGIYTELDVPLRRGHEGDFAWSAEARTGLLREAQEVLDLSGDVTLRYSDESVEFHSEEMRLNLRRRTAQSLVPVRIQQGDNRTDAEQMFAELDRHRARLSGSVRTRYVPEG